MSSEHKRPLYAFALVALLCAFFVGSGLRSDAIGGLSRIVAIPAELHLVVPTKPAPQAPDEVVAPRGDGSALMAAVAPRRPAAATTPAAPRADVVVAADVESPITPATHSPQARVDDSADKHPGRGKGPRSDRREKSTGPGKRVRPGHDERGHGRGRSGEHPRRHTSTPGSTDRHKPGKARSSQRGVGKAHGRTRLAAKPGARQHRWTTSPGAARAKHGTHATRGKTSLRGRSASTAQRQRTTSAVKSGKAVVKGAQKGRGKGKGKGHR